MTRKVSFTTDQRMANGSFSSLMDSHDAARIGWWMLWRGLWGIIRRRSTIVISTDWKGPR